MSDLALKVTTERWVGLSAEDVSNTLRAICAHRAVARAKPVQQPMAQLAVA